jgi:crossover junction endodeoxyribonuclease RuvC
VIYIGIDPGLSGAVAVIQDTEAYYGEHRINVFDTPTALVKGEKTKRRYLMGSMALLLQPYAKQQDVVAVLENVHSMPSQGVSSSFCFGEGKGLWEGILAAYNIPMELVSPQRWKKTIMADQGKDKSAARFKAMALFPSLADQLKLVKHDGRAEALLMAEYARRLRSGK